MELPEVTSGTLDRSFIRVKALAVVVHPDRERHLVFRALQDGRPLNRPLGGGIELGETSREAVVREIVEELGARFTPRALLGTVENIFAVGDETAHEVVFLWAGDLDDPETVPPEGREYAEIDGSAQWAEWRPVHGSDPDVPLYPPGLQALVEEWLEC